LFKTRKYTSILLVVYFFISLISANSKIFFSADNLQNINNENENKRIFNNNVFITKDNIELHAKSAVHYPDSFKVYLQGDVIMYHQSDSLFCNEFILYDQELEKFTALGDIMFYKDYQLLKSQTLKYTTIDKNNNIFLEIINNASIQDSLRTIKGDSIYMQYQDTVIKNIKVKKNAEVFNYRYAKVDSLSKKQIFEDYLKSKNMNIDFNSGELSYLELLGMSITKFNVIRDSLVNGINSTSGDSILIYMNNDVIDTMYVKNGARGEFIPEKNNSNIESTVEYTANEIHYFVNQETSYLIDNANVNFDNTKLSAGEIYVNWATDNLEARQKDNILPSVSGFSEAPTYGDLIKYNFVTKRGKLLKGQTTTGQSDQEMFYQGDEILRTDDLTYFMSNSLFTSCDNITPHYYFKSKQMKMISDDKIFAKPMTFYLHDYPVITIPFAVLPNKGDNRLSGLIMPSFGNRSDTGTYIDDFGYYFAPNDYMDYRILIDIRDKGGIKHNNRLRYNRKSGKSWYQLLEGYLIYEKNLKLIDENQDILNLFQDGSSEKYQKVKFKHFQKFDPYQYLNIDYSYSNTINYQTISLKERLTQKNTANFSYSKIWGHSSLNIGYNAEENLVLTQPTASENINKYKFYSGPDFSYNISKSIMDLNDKWYSKIRYTYSLNYKDGYKNHQKEACIDKNHDGVCDDDQTTGCTDDNDDGMCDDCIDDNEDGFCDEDFNWSNEDILTQNYGGIKNTLSFTTPSPFKLFTVKPNFFITYDIVNQYNDSDDNGIVSSYKKTNDRLSWSSSLTFGASVYGILPLNLGNLIAIRHKIDPEITINYSPNRQKYYEDQYFENNGLLTDKLSQTSAASLTDGQQYITFSLNNNFQAKRNNLEGVEERIELFDFNLSTSYDKEGGFENNLNRKFDKLNALIRLSKPQGQKIFDINFVYDLYDDYDNLFFKKGKMPKLEKLTFVMSHVFKFSGSNYESDDHLTLHSDQTDSLSMLGNTTLLETENFIPSLNSSNIWETSFAININATYENKDWMYDNLIITPRSTIKLTKNWLLSYTTSINLLDMKMLSQDIVLTRDLHCWNFKFYWSPGGSGTQGGFRLKINLKHPSLQDLKLRSTSSNYEGLDNF